MSDEEAVRLLMRCRGVLANMAWEREGAIFNRWPINHEPLRSDAKNLVPLIDDFMFRRQQSTITPALDAAIQDEIEHGPKDIMK